MQSPGLNGSGSAGSAYAGAANVIAAATAKAPATARLATAPRARSENQDLMRTIPSVGANRHLAIHARRGYVPAPVASFWREAQRAVEPNDFAVEVIVFDDALHEGAVFGRPAHPLGEGDLRAPIGLELVACLAISGSQECAGGDGDDAYAERGQVASGDQCHADDAALGRRVGQLSDLALVGGDRRGIDDDAARTLVDRFLARDRRGGQPQHVEYAGQVNVDRGLDAV